MFSPELWNETGLLQTGDYTANRQFVKTKNACAARAEIFAKCAFGGVKAHFAKLQMKRISTAANDRNGRSDPASICCRNTRCFFGAAAPQKQLKRKAARVCSSSTVNPEYATNRLSRAANTIINNCKPRYREPLFEVASLHDSSQGGWLRPLDPPTHLRGGWINFPPKEVSTRRWRMRIREIAKPEMSAIERILKRNGNKRRPYNATAT